MMRKEEGVFYADPGRADPIGFRLAETWRRATTPLALWGPTRAETGSRRWHRAQEKLARGAGIGLLLAARLSDARRRDIGWTLVAVGLLTTLPLALMVFDRRRLPARPLHGDQQRQSRLCEPGGEDSRPGAQLRAHPSRQ